MTEIKITKVTTARDLRRFIDVQYALNEGVSGWIAPLKSEVRALLDANTNPWFDHGEAVFFIAVLNGVDVGRISAQVDQLWEELSAAQGGGANCGNWGLFEAADENIARALIFQAKRWLKERGMKRMVGPLSLSIWDEPGLLIDGVEHPPTVMMGHHRLEYSGWIEKCGNIPLHYLKSYELDITCQFPQVVQKIIRYGENNKRISVREIRKSDYVSEAKIILGILNDAWIGNWGIVPLTDREISYAAKKLKPIIFQELVRIIEYDSEPVAFMMTLPDVNEMMTDLNGKLYPFGFVKLLWRLHGGFKGRPKVKRMRVPLMGVKREFQSTALASQFAFMLIESIRQVSVSLFGAERAEIGWISETNKGMISIADVIGSSVNRTYCIYEQVL